MMREEFEAQQRIQRAGRFTGVLASGEAIMIYTAIMELADPKFQRAKVISSSGRGKVFYNVHLAMNNASWQQTIRLIIDDVTVNVITDERGELDPRLSGAIEAAVKSFNLQDENAMSPSQSLQTPLPVRTATQISQSISSSNGDVTNTVDVGSINGNMVATSISTTSLVLMPGDKQGKGNAAQVDLDKQESSDSGSDDGWDKIGEDET
ncbi:hypothetical protein FFLO_05287 [Filobasidium floriforme]|uniref:Uncharacterized protein n=1 Tax=Filobasidium floriforme TaxID=5210 RepID=A0A8K0JHR5_9TREE|nr:hypothetical protein FFLO_05287 [Filobasidium floriforme]